MSDRNQAKRQTETDDDEEKIFTVVNQVFKISTDEAKKARPKTNKPRALKSKSQDSRFTYEKINVYQNFMKKEIESEDYLKILSITNIYRIYTQNFIRRQLAKWLQNISFRKVEVPVKRSTNIMDVFKIAANSLEEERKVLRDLKKIELLSKWYHPEESPPKSDKKNQRSSIREGIQAINAFDYDSNPNDKTLALLKEELQNMLDEPAIALTSENKDLNIKNDANNNPAKADNQKIPASENKNEEIKTNDKEEIPSEVSKPSNATKVDSKEDINNAATEKVDQSPEKKEEETTQKNEVPPESTNPKETKLTPQQKRLLRKTQQQEAIPVVQTSSHGLSEKKNYYLKLRVKLNGYFSRKNEELLISLIKKWNSITMYLVKTQTENIVAEADDKTKKNEEISSNQVVEAKPAEAVEEKKEENVEFKPTEAVEEKKEVVVLEVDENTSENEAIKIEKKKEHLVEDVLENNQHKPNLKLLVEEESGKKQETLFHNDEGVLNEDELKIVVLEDEMDQNNEKVEVNKRVDKVVEDANSEVLGIRAIEKKFSLIKEGITTNKKFDSEMKEDTSFIREQDSVFEELVNTQKKIVDEDINLTQSSPPQKENINSINLTTTNNNEDIKETKVQVSSEEAKTLLNLAVDNVKIDTLECLNNFVKIHVDPILEQKDDDNNENKVTTGEVANNILYESNNLVQTIFIPITNDLDGFKYESTETKVKDADTEANANDNAASNKENVVVEITTYSNAVNTNTINHDIDSKINNSSAAVEDKSAVDNILKIINNNRVVITKCGSSQARALANDNKNNNIEANDIKKATDAAVEIKVQNVISEVNKDYKKLDQAFSKSSYVRINYRYMEEIGRQALLARSQYTSNLSLTATGAGNTNNYNSYNIANSATNTNYDLYNLKKAEDKNANLAYNYSSNNFNNAFYNSYLDSSANANMKANANFNANPYPIEGKDYFYPPTSTSIYMQQPNALNVSVSSLTPRTYGENNLNIVSSHQSHTNLPKTIYNNNSITPITNYNSANYYSNSSNYGNNITQVPVTASANIENKCKIVSSNLASPKKTESSIAKEKLNTPSKSNYNYSYANYGYNFTQNSGATNSLVNNSKNNYQPLVSSSNSNYNYNFAAYPVNNYTLTNNQPLVSASNSNSNYNLTQNITPANQVGSNTKSNYQTLVSTSNYNNIQVSPSEQDKKTCPTTTNYNLNNNVNIKSSNNSSAYTQLFSTSTTGKYFEVDAKLDDILKKYGNYAVEQKSLYTPNDTQVVSSGKTNYNFSSGATPAPNVVSSNITNNDDKSTNMKTIYNY